MKWKSFTLLGLLQSKQHTVSQACEHHCQDMRGPEEELEEGQPYKEDVMSGVSLFLKVSTPRNCSSVRAGNKTCTSCVTALFYLVTSRSGRHNFHLFKQTNTKKENSPELSKQAGREHAHRLAPVWSLRSATDLRSADDI